MKKTNFDELNGVKINANFYYDLTFFKNEQGEIILKDCRKTIKPYGLYIPLSDNYELIVTRRKSYGDPYEFVKKRYEFYKEREEDDDRNICNMIFDILKKFWKSIIIEA